MGCGMYPSSCWRFNFKFSYVTQRILFSPNRRWLFCTYNRIGSRIVVREQSDIDLNLPICALDAIFVLLFLRLKTPPATLWEKLSKIDIMRVLVEFVLQGSDIGRTRGNILVTGSITSVVIALTWGGVQYPWSSARVLSSLILGLLGLCVFLIYEIYFCKPPIVSPFASTIRVISTVFNILFQEPYCFSHELDVCE